MLLTISYDNKTNEDRAVMLVAETNSSSITVIKMFTDERAERLYKELTEPDEIVKKEGN